MWTQSVRHDKTFNKQHCAFVTQRQITGHTTSKALALITGTFISSTIYTVSAPSLLVYCIIYIATKHTAEVYTSIQHFYTFTFGFKIKKSFHHGRC